MADWLSLPIPHGPHRQTCLCSALQTDPVAPPSCQALPCAAQVSRFSPQTGPAPRAVQGHAFPAHGVPSLPQIPPCTLLFLLPALQTQTRLCSQQPLPGEGAAAPGGSELLLQPCRVWSPLCAPAPAQPCVSAHLKTGKVFFKRMRRVRKASNSQSPGSDGCTDNTALFSSGMLGMFCTAVSHKPNL